MGRATSVGKRETKLFPEKMGGPNGCLSICFLAGTPMGEVFRMGFALKPWVWVRMFPPRLQGFRWGLVLGQPGRGGWEWGKLDPMDERLGVGSNMK